MATAAEQLTNTLVLACRADPAAEKQLNQWKSQNVAEFAHGLALQIGNGATPPEARQMAGLYLKNMLYAKSLHFLQANLQQWQALSKEQRGLVKQALLASLSSTEPHSAHSAALAASEVAAVELPYNEWPEFVPTLLQNLTAVETPEVVQLACLECLGYTLERLGDLEEMIHPPELNTGVVDSMLTTIVQGVQASKPDTMRFAALTALRNSLMFIRKNMLVKAERDHIVKAICEATQSADARVRSLAFGCFDNIADCYYELLGDYMTTIFQLTTQAISNKEEKEEVQMAAIEVWSTLAYMEQGLLDEERDYEEQDIPLTDRPPCPKYTHSAMETLVPMLLDTLTKQDEDVDDEIWNLQSAGSVCLEFISSTVESAIVPVVMPFVERHITSDQWRLRDAAIVAFGSILDGPSTNEIGAYCAQAIPVLLGAFNDPHVVVRDSATHCISKICRLHVEAIAPEMIHNIIQGLMAKLQEPSPRVASHACFAIFNIAHSLKEEQMPNTNILSAPMLPLLKELLKATDREDAVEGNLRTSAMSAAAELVNAAAADCLEIFKELLPLILQRMDACLKMQLVSKDDQETREQILGHLCALVQVLFLRLDKQAVLPQADVVMNLLLQVLQVRNATCHEEAFLAIGAIATTLEDDFTKYMQAFIPLLLNGLKSIQARSLCMVSVGVVVDLASSVGANIQPFCDDIMTALREALQDASVDRDIKPVVISAFGDVAMAIGRAYEPYLNISVMMLMQASQQQAPSDDDELLMFINQLRLSVLEAYSGIIIGLADGQGLELLVPHMPAILQFLVHLSQPESSRDELVLYKAVALVGDICQQVAPMYPAVRQQMTQQFVSVLLNEATMSATTSEDMASLEIVQWTRGVVEQQIVAVQQQPAA